MARRVLPLVVLTMVIGCQGQGGPDPAQLPRATLNGVTGSFAVGCWTWAGPIFGGSVCDGPSAAGEGSPGGPPYRLAFTGNASPIAPESFTVVAGGAVDIDHNPHGQGHVDHPQWGFQSVIPVDSVGELGPIPDGPWTSLSVNAVYPQGDIYFGWPLDVPPVSACTGAFAQGVADASLIWVESFDIDGTPGAPGSLTDTSVPVPRGLDRLGDHLDPAIGLCPTTASWESAWNTFLGELIDGNDALSFLASRCTDERLSDQALCQEVAVGS